MAGGAALCRRAEERFVARKAVVSHGAMPRRGMPWSDPDVCGVERQGTNCEQYRQYQSQYEATHFQFQKSRMLTI